MINLCTSQCKPPSPQAAYLRELDFEPEKLAQDLTHRVTDTKKIPCSFLTDVYTSHTSQIFSFARIASIQCFQNLMTLDVASCSKFITIQNACVLI